MIDVGSILAEGRAVAESRMTDACVITNAGGVPVWNDTTEQYDLDEAATVYIGKCRVKLNTARLSGEPDAGDTTRVVLTPTLHIPADTLDVEIGHVATITAAAYNPRLEGRAFRISSLFLDSQATAQRLDCTDVES